MKNKKHEKLIKGFFPQKKAETPPMLRDNTPEPKVIRRKSTRALQQQASHKTIQRIFYEAYGR